MRAEGVRIALQLAATAWAVAIVARWHRLDRVVAAPRTRSLAIVIPTFNEADKIGALVDRLRAQLRPEDELVVADNSTDPTAVAAAAAGATVVSTGAPAPGWVGKTWNCAHGAYATTNDLLVFLDADVEPDPTFLDKLVALHELSPTALLTVAPYHRVARPYELLSAAPNLVSVLAVGRRSPTVFGPCVALSRVQYHAIGGHDAVADSIVDDLALGRRAQQLNIAIRRFLGGTTLRYRMYPTGFGSLLEGWTKNLCLGAKSTWRPAVLAAVGWVCSVFDTTRSALSDPTASSVTTLAVVMAAAGWMFSRIGNFGLAAGLLVSPLAVVFVALFTGSFVLTTALRKVRWKGRWLDVGPERTPRSSPT